MSIQRLGLRVEQLHGESTARSPLVCITESDSPWIPKLKTGEARLVHEYDVLQIDPAVDASATK